MAPVIEKVGPKCMLGEGPHWDAETQTLYYVDVGGKTIHKYVPSTREHAQVVVGSDSASIVVPVEGEPNKFVVTSGKKLFVVTWDGKSDTLSDVKILAEVTSPGAFNDGKCDPSGRLWTGTLGHPIVNLEAKNANGSLYSWSNNVLNVHLSGLSIANGLAWSSDKTLFYYIDTGKGYVEQFDFDVTKGQISNGKVIFTLSKHGIEGYLDGMTIDADDNLWIAIFNGSCVIQIDTRKPETLLQKIDMPTKQITSAAFGGAALDELYVTSGSYAFGGEDLSAPEHGATYKITGLGVKGLPGVYLLFFLFLGNINKKFYIYRILIKKQCEKTHSPLHYSLSSVYKCIILAIQIAINLDQFSEPDSLYCVCLLIKTRMAKVETITRSAFLAEGPHWDATNQCLYFVDIYGRSINKYVPATKEHTKAVIESKNPSVIGTDSVSLIIPVEGQKDKFLISIGKDLVVVTWDGKSPKVSNIERLVTVEGGGAINDGKCDATGRLWAGTLGGVWSDKGKLEGKNGILFTLNNKQINTHLTGISISNGLTWSLDNKTFYYIDSSTGCLEQYDCDITNGTITNRKTILTLSKHGIPGHFDGMTIDLDGNLWIAIFNGSRVIKVNPREQDSILQTVNIPALQVTSVAFGGPNLDELYVTSAALPVDGKPLTGPNDGATFKVTGLEVQGCAALYFR